MTAGGPAIRKLTSTRESALAAMRLTLADFRNQTSNWQREVEQLFDDLEAVGVHAALEAAAASGSDDAAARERLVELSSHQQELARQQQSATDEITALRQAVEQQMELMLKFMSSPHPTVGAAIEAGECHHDPVVDAVQAQFEQLQRQVQVANRAR